MYFGFVGRMMTRTIITELTELILEDPRESKEAKRAFWRWPRCCCATSIAHSLGKSLFEFLSGMRRPLPAVSMVHSADSSSIQLVEVWADSRSQIRVSDCEPVRSSAINLLGCYNTFRKVLTSKKALDGTTRLEQSREITKKVQELFP